MPNLILLHLNNSKPTGKYLYKHTYEEIDIAKRVEMNLRPNRNTE